MYVKHNYPFYKKPKELLDKKGLKYEEIDVLQKSDLFNDIKSKSNTGIFTKIHEIENVG
jgi:glutaredoxin 3